MLDAWKERQRKRLENRPERTVFYNIFSTMMLVLTVEVLLAVVSIFATNVTGQLDENAKDLLTMRVRNRASYVQDLLLNAEDLEQLSEQINATTQQMLKSGAISLDTLDNSSEQSDALLVALAPQLLDTLRAKQVTGIFIMLNTHDLDTCEVDKKMPGIYLRDLDPDARPSERNSDLLLERASATVVKKLGIGTDKGWQPAFPYQADTKGGILRTVFQAAYKSGAALSAENYGRWTTNSYCLAGDDRHAIAYSQPLILPDGTVYGVVGVELLTEYLQTKLPFTELDEDKAGTYFIMSTTDALTDGELTLRKTVTSGEDLVTADAPLGILNCHRDAEGDDWLELDNKRYYMVLEPLQMYNRNAPFTNEQWFLAGAMEQSVLLAFSDRVRRVLLTTILVTLVLGVFGSLLVSASLAMPINHLYREVVDAQERKTFPHLSRTGIREVDRFAETITELNKELVTNSTKFLRIMDMASVELGGYELRTDTGSVFVTDNFFPLLGMPGITGKLLSVRRFEEVLKGIRENTPCTRTAEGDELLTIRQPDGVRYIMLRSTIEGHAKIGLAEDVTAAALERMRIEHERDYDVLTGLYNRQAFNRVCAALFAQPERMGVAALMMMDLDNLKHINDTYGHDWGDQYIRRTGQCLRENTPVETVCARLSGDEFLVLFYGYHSRDAVREKIGQLSRAMQQSVALLPSGNTLHISLSGGIAWYPDDGQDWETLKKYADFAMYQVKHASKGRVEEFDIGVYNREAYAERTRREFQQLLSNEQVFYCFQPIFSAYNGKVFAYEALMRSDLPNLRSPATIMKLAREQGALYEIERITFTKALETFDSLCRAGSVSGDAMLFVNSIASTSLTQEDVEYLNTRWHELCRRVVIEITEEEAIDHEALEKKRNAPGFTGMFALDDYGSGYANENSLLELAPRFIKVDIAIIRGIDASPDKQQILRNVVAYAHPRCMKIVAEGVETAAELRTVIGLGADLLQGCFLARPAIVPEVIAPEAAAVIQEQQRREKD
jgi:diguanylate cyclase (GGDEF)-like protein